MTAQLITETLDMASKFSHSYEKRFFVIGLSKLLLCPTLPPSLQPLLMRTISELVGMVEKLNT